MIDLPSGQNKVIFRMDAVNSLGFAAKEEKLYLSATDLFRHFSDYSDLYEFDLKKDELKRLSRGKRLSHPVSIDNSEWIFCVQRRNGSYRLALFSKKTGEAKSISMAFAGMSQISVSPTGRRIAAAAKPVGGPWGVAIFLENGNLDRFLSVTASDLSQPRWQDDEKLLFIVNGKETSSLASYSLDMNNGWRLEDPRFSGTRQFDLAANGQEIFYTYFSGRGEEIARSTTEWTPLSPLEITAQRKFPQPRRPRQQRIGPAPTAQSATCCRTGGRRHCAPTATRSRPASLPAARTRWASTATTWRAISAFPAIGPACGCAMFMTGCCPPFRSPMPTATNIFATLIFSGAARS